LYSKYALFQSQYLEFIESQIKNVRDYQDKVEVEEKSEIKTKDTDSPKCPWCNREYTNYADFGFRNREQLQCVECDKDFLVIRGVKDVYTTTKIKNKRGIFKSPLLEIMKMSDEITEICINNFGTVIRIEGDKLGGFITETDLRGWFLEQLDAKVDKKSSKLYRFK
jgi:hypothetical protein